MEDDTMSRFTNWVVNTGNYKPVLTKRPASEIDLARQIYESEAARDTVKNYYEQLKPLIICDVAESNKLRNKANILYKQDNNLIKAAYLYTKAIYKAPMNSSCLARAHANRAVVLYKLQSYEAAFEDCECAVEFNHPSMHSVLLRQVAIARKLNDHHKMQQCIKSFHDFNIEVPHSVEIYREKSKENIFSSQLPAEQSRLKRPKFSKLKLSRSPTRGRFYIADQNIETGEQVLEENLVVHAGAQDIQFRQAFFSDEENELVFTCENCCEPDIVPFPCYECRCVFYCSKKCREEHSSIHRFECGGYKIQLIDENWVKHMALRLLLTSFDDILRKLQHINKGTAVHMAEELWPILLQTGEDGELISLHSNYQNLIPYNREGLFAFLFCYYLSDQTDFFERSHRERLTVMPSEVEWHIVVIGLYLRFITTSMLNAMSVNRMTLVKPFAVNNVHATGLYSSLTVDFSKCGIYPWFCFLNHSCDANANAYVSNLKINMYSKRRIDRGEEVTFDYMSESAKIEKSERRHHMRQYFGDFDCDCKRCENEEDPIFVKYSGAPCTCGGHCLISKDGCLCSKCGEKFDLQHFVYSAMREAPNTPEEFVYHYGILAILRKRFGNMCCHFFKHVAEKVLRKYLESTNAKVLDNDTINSFMIKLAVDLLEVTQNPYVQPLHRAQFAAMLLDIVVIRKKKGFEPLHFDYKTIVEEAIWFMTGKPRKMFDELYKLYCL